MFRFSWRGSSRFYSLIVWSISERFTMNKKYVLVVIDMQLEFYRRCKDNFTHPDGIRQVAKNIEKEILLAKRLDNPVLIVTYSGAGRNIPIISKAYHGYQKAKRVSKRDDDGAKEIDCSLRGDHSLPLRICGVNTTCCVQETALSLRHDFGYNVEVMQAASWDEYGIEDHLVAMMQMKEEGIVIRKRGWKDLSRRIGYMEILV